MTSPHMPADGAFPVDVEATERGVALKTEAFVQHIVHGVVEALLTEKYGDRFDGLVDMQSRDPHLIERPGDLPVESLVADLVAEVGTKLPIRGMQALQLAYRLIEVTSPRAVPQQRTEGGAAA